MSVLATGRIAEHFRNSIFGTMIVALAVSVIGSRKNIFVEIDRAKLPFSAGHFYKNHLFSFTTRMMRPLSVFANAEYVAQMLAGSPPFASFASWRLFSRNWVMSKVVVIEAPVRKMPSFAVHYSTSSFACSASYAFKNSYSIQIYASVDESHPIPIAMLLIPS